MNTLNKSDALRERVKSCISYKLLASKLDWAYWMVKEKLGGFIPMTPDEVKAIEKILTREEGRK